MINVVKARAAIGNLLSGHNVPEEIQTQLSNIHDALLAYERSRPDEQAEAFKALAGPREDWEIA